jgi:hypothetical protein
MGNDTAARLRALEAKIDAQTARITMLEAVNSRLIACVSRFTAMFDDHSLAITEWAVEEFTARDEEAVQTQAELAAAIRSRASRRIPITVIENVFRKEDDREHFLSWITALHNLEWRGWKLESLLLKKGLIDNEEHTELTVPHR